MPGRSAAISGAWPASTPKSPSAPGTSTSSTSPEKTRRAGEASSKGKVAMLSRSELDLAALDREAETEPEQSPDQRKQRDVPRLARSQLVVRPPQSLACDLDVQFSDPDLRRFRPREVADQRSGD